MGAAADRRPVDWGFTDRARTASAPAAVRPRSTSAVTSATTRPTSRRTGPRSPRPWACPASGSLFMNQCHGADVARRRRARGPDRRRAVDALVTTTRATSPSPSWSPTARPVLLADPAAGVVAAVHAGRPGMTAGIVEPDRRGDAGRSGATCDSSPRSGRRCAAAATRCRTAMRERGRRGRARRPRRCPGPARRRSTWRAGSSTSCAPIDVAVQWVPGCTAGVARPVLLPPRRPDRPVRGRRRELPAGEPVSDAAADAPSWPPGSPRAGPHRARLRRRGTATRARSSSSP